VQYRSLGKTGVRVSEIGLGCWQFGGDFGPITQQDGDRTMDAAIAAGINFFDTANVYGGGRSEMWIGEYLKRTGEPIFVATKYGRGAGVYPDGYSLTGMRQAVVASIERLRTQCLDLLQLHCVPTEILRRGEIFDWLRTLQQEGLIAHFGASVETVEEGLICLEQPGLQSLQVIFNIFRQKPALELFPAAQQKSVGIIVRLPLASGLLSGKYNAQTTFEQTDHRNYNRDGQHFNVGETFAGLPFSKAIELVEELRPLVVNQWSMTEFALRWILDHPEVSTVIAGARLPEQVRQNALSSKRPPLEKSSHQELADYYRLRVHEHIRGPY
jgi:aryl-alcohol dehydrogenase-like predicted oxidoreductase